MFDEEPVRKTHMIQFGGDLSALSVLDLEARLLDLRAEIARTEAALEGKKQSMARAENFFKK